MTDIFEDGNRLVKFYHAPDKNIYTILDEIGQMPFPPISLKSWKTRSVTRPSIPRKKAAPQHRLPGCISP